MRIIAFLFLILQFHTNVIAQYDVNLKLNELNKVTFNSESKIQLNAYKVDSAYYLIAHYTLPPNVTNRIIPIQYIANGYYYIKCPISITEDEIRIQQITSMYYPDLKLKCNAEVYNQLYPIHALNIGGYVDLRILLFEQTDIRTLQARLQLLNASVLEFPAERAIYFPVRVPVGRVHELCMLPFIHYVEPILPDAQIVNFENNATHTNFYLKSVAPGGPGLSGAGVVVGEGDDGNITTHIDYNDRVIDRASNAASNHATHVGGTIAGRGILNPLHEGMAPKSTLIGEYFTNIIGATDQHVRDFNMVLTSNSYYSGAAGCTSNGLYSSSSNFADDQQFRNDTLLHVFAAGNDGSYTCAPYPAAFHTVKSNWQIAKNTLVVASMQDNLNISSFSSRGPCDDGRIKPEITATGSNVTSTLPNNGYGSMSGTSMATPTVSGTLSLLIEEYRRTHSGASPLGGLIKAIACNTAIDRGNPGPDYTFGFGVINAVRARNVILNDQFIISSVSHGTSNNHTINVPSGADQLKVMLYWIDPPADPAVPVNLVNDLNMQLTTPTSVVVNPWVLDQTPANVDNNAIRGRDSLNNVEQITISSPVNGVYTINVNGFNVPSGPQRYILTYEIINPSVEVTWPNGGDPIIANTTVFPTWNAFGGEPNTFTVEYSLNNGVSWTNISSIVPSTDRRVSWTVPNVASNQALIRVIRNVAGYADTSNAPFVILAQPVITATTLCEGYVRLTWPPIAGITSYDVMMKAADSMRVIANITDTFYDIRGLPTGIAQHLAIRGKIGSTVGMRSIAAVVTPNSGPCTLPIFDNDLKMQSINTNTGRIFTSNALSSTQTIAVTIKNLDNTATTGSYTLYYQINGGAIISQSISTVIASLATLNHNFTTTANLSSIGTYTIKAWVTRTGDVQTLNDTLIKVVRQLSNPVVTLPAFEGFETVSTTPIIVSTTGLEGDDRLDFIAQSGTRNRARSFVSNSAIRTGNKAMSLDARSFNSALTQNYLLFTQNMTSYNTSNDIRMDFYFMHHGNTSHAGDSVWIRGSDTSAWIAVYSLFANQAAVGTYRFVSGINISALLLSRGQSYSSSFQIRFGWQGTKAIDNATYTDGYTFDDINIYQIVDDVSALAITSPTTFNCGVTTTNIVANFRNNVSTTLSNIPVAYKLNTGAWIFDTIPSIAGNTTVSHTFSTPINISAFGFHSISILCHLGSDSYRLNDTIKNYTILNQPVVAAFPYFEPFESNHGNYFSAGTPNGWTWGTPTKTIINKAANGMRAWVTRLNGNYLDNANTVLYSPCFNLSGLSNPMLSFSHIYQTENGWDFMWVEYSTNGGSTWTKLGNVGSGTNWYNDVATITWDNTTNTLWHVASCPIPTTASSVRFRFVFTSDGSINYEGVGIDDIHIFDRTTIYTGASNPTIAAQSVSGSNWTHFLSGGMRVMSINPNGQNLGNTNVNVYLNTSGIRNDSVQYYLDRNLVISPQNSPSSPVRVRFYFTDSEANALINASGCTVCSKIADAYESGITKFSATNSIYENGSLVDNTGRGTFSFILPSQVEIIPYDNGYYAEYDVNSFSEFWINDGGQANNLPLPVSWLSFNATKDGEDANITWSTATEINCDYYDIEVSENQPNNFRIISTVKGAGNSATTKKYSYIDIEKGKQGIRYYRIKQYDFDGTHDITPIKALRFDSKQNIFVAPNPFTTSIYIMGDATSYVRYEVTDLQGRIIMQGNFEEIKQIEFDEFITSGSYLLKVYSNSEETKSFLIQKQ